MVYKKSFTKSLLYSYSDVLYYNIYNVNFPSMLSCQDVSCVSFNFITYRLYVLWFSMLHIYPAAGISQDNALRTECYICHTVFYGLFRGSVGTSLQTKNNSCGEFGSYLGLYSNNFHLDFVGQSQSNLCLWYPILWRELLSLSFHTATSSQLLCLGYGVHQWNISFALQYSIT